MDPDGGDQGQQQPVAANVPPVAAADGIARQTAVRNIQSAVSTTPFPKWTQGANVDNFLTGIANAVGAAAWQVSEIMVQFRQNEALLDEQFMAYFSIDDDVQVEQVVNDLYAGDDDHDPGGLAQLYLLSNWLKIFDNSLAAKIADAFADHGAKDSIRTTVANEHRRCGRANPMQQSGALVFTVLKKKIRGEGEQHAETAIAWLRDEGTRSNYPTHVGQIGPWIETARKKFDQQNDITEVEFCKRAQRKLVGLFPVSWDFKNLARTLENLDTENNRDLHRLETEVATALNTLKAAFPAKFGAEGGANLTDTRGYEKNQEKLRRHQKKNEKKQNAAKGTPTTATVAPVKGKDGGDGKGKKGDGNYGGKGGGKVDGAKYGKGGGKHGGKGGGKFGGAKSGKKGDKNNKGKKKGGDGKCFICGSADHWAAECPNRAQNAYPAQTQEWGNNTQQQQPEVATPAWQAANEWDNWTSAQPAEAQQWDDWSWQNWHGEAWNQQPSAPNVQPAQQNAHGESFTNGHDARTLTSRPVGNLAQGPWTLKNALRNFRG